MRYWQIFRGRDQTFHAVLPLNHLAALGLRCGQPGQQHGRFLPAFKSSCARSILLIRVSTFFADVTQQIHSFCARAVSSSQTFLTADVAFIALCRSAGKLWTGPGKVFVVLFVSFVILLLQVSRLAVNHSSVSITLSAHHRQ